MREFLLVVTFSVVAHSASAAGVVYSRTESFSTIRASYEALYATFERVRTFVASANRDHESDTEEETLVLSADDLSIRFDAGFLEQDLSDLPVATSVRYEYRNYGAPIDHVEIWLWDSARTSKISGSSQEQVDALQGLVGSDIRNLEAGFGGVWVRFLGGAFLVLLGAALATLPMLTHRIFPDIIFVVIGLCLQGSVWVLPWASWFPGTMVVAGEASFLVRYAPLVSFFGVILTLVTFVVSIAYSAYLTRDRHS